MSKYRKKPVEVEAIQFRRDCFQDVREFTEGKATCFRTERCINGKSYCEVKTPEGIMTATEGDYIIKGINGEFYLCKPDVFEMTYEPAEREFIETAKAVVDAVNKMQMQELVGRDILNF